jgi:hypothetical protein
MDLKTLLREQIERESAYLSKQEVGTEEYCKSQERLNNLEEKMADYVKFEDNRKDRTVKNVIEGAKTVGGIVLPVIGLVAITAFEKNDSFTTSLRGFVNCFIPKKF